MQTQLTEHLQEREGMRHQTTIDRPFSDEHTLSLAERDAENAAFLSRVRAATHEVMAMPGLTLLWWQHVLWIWGFHGAALTPARSQQSAS